VRFAFAGFGERAPVLAAPTNRLYLDVGNDLRPGVIDHHHLTAYSGSTASMVLAHPQLVLGALAPDRRPGDPLTIILHEHPDLDGVVSSFLSISYLTTGSFPRGREALARYADKVDEGCLGMTLANPFSLYSAYMQLANRMMRRSWNSPHEGWQECVRRGLDLVAFVVEQVDRQGLPLDRVDAFACPGLFTPDDRREVQDDLERYQRKLADPKSHARQVRIKLPGQFGGTVEADALLARDVQNADDPERCIFFKDWARSDEKRCPSERGFVALCVFMSPGPHQVRRAIISVRPDAGVTLRGLGALLDQAEGSRRIQVFGIDDRVVDPTTGSPKPPRPGYANADPWYDGRAHGHTIVDAPRAGTLLTADEIESIFLRFGQGAAKHIKM
jgi:hypothetical protein